MGELTGVWPSGWKDERYTAAACVLAQEGWLCGWVATEQTKQSVYVCSIARVDTDGIPKRCIWHRKDGGFDQRNRELHPCLQLRCPCLYSS